MDEYNLPRSYGKPRLVLLVVDPYLLHAYWEVATEKLNELQEQAAQQAILRFYRSKPAYEDAPTDQFDVEVDIQSRNWYVHLWRPEESLYADLVLKRNDGTLLILVRSRMIRMPPAEPKMSIEQRFMRVVDATERRAEILPSRTRPAATTINAAEILQESLKKVYASRLWRWEQFKVESMGSANIPSPPPGRPAIDLTAMAEKFFRAGTSSGASDTKK